MNTIKFENKGAVRMVAHRGVSGLERENTNAAFVAAGVKTYYGIETDIHLTKDGKFIIIHNDTTTHVTGVELSVENSTFAKLRSLRCKDRDGLPRGDLQLPSLEEYVRICKKYDKQAVLEIKKGMPDAKVVKAVEIVKSLGWYKRTTFISFNGDNLVAIRKKYPDADIQFLFSLQKGERFEKHLEFMERYKFDADVYYQALTKERVQQMHEKGIKVNCWTVNTVADAEKVKEMGVDFITTNILE